MVKGRMESPIFLFLFADLKTARCFFKDRFDESHGAFFARPVADPPAPAAHISASSPSRSTPTLCRSGSPPPPIRPGRAVNIAP